MEKFETVFRGYDKNQVNKTLDDIIKNYEILLNKCKEQELENKTLKEKLSYFEDKETILNKAIFSSEDTCAKMRDFAKQEAEAIIKEAKRNANRIVNDALMRTEKAEEEVETLKRNLRIFKKRVRKIVESQLDVIDELDEIKLDEYN